MALVVVPQPVSKQTDDVSPSPKKKTRVDFHKDRLVFQLCQLDGVDLEQSMCLHFFVDFNITKSLEALKKNYKKLADLCHPKKVKENNILSCFVCSEPWERESCLHSVQCLTK